MKRRVGIGAGVVLALTLLAGTAQAATAPQPARIVQHEKSRLAVEQATDRVAEARKHMPAVNERDQAHAEEMIRSASRHLAKAQTDLESGDPVLVKSAQLKAERALRRLDKARKLQEGVR